MKWAHLALKVIGAIIIFKLGVLVGEHKMMKALVLRGGGDHPKMLFRGGEMMGEAGARAFQKRFTPMGREGDVMMWRADTAQPAPAPVTLPPSPPPAPTAPTQP